LFPHGDSAGARPGLTGRGSGPEGFGRPLWGPVAWSTMSFPDDRPGPMIALGWQPNQGGPFREKVGKALWDTKWKEVQVGGKDADKVDVVIWAAVPERHVEDAVKLDDRDFIRIISEVDLWDPNDGTSNRYLLKKNFKKVYVLKKDADLKDCAFGESKDEWPDNVARFTSGQMDIAWRETEKKIQKNQVLVMHFTSISSARLILGEGSHGLRAAKAGQGGGGLSVVYLPFDPRDPQFRYRHDFDKIDKNGDRSLDKDELHAAYMGRGDLAGKKSQDEVAAMFDVLDANGDAKITLEEYKNYHYFVEDNGGDPAVLKVLARFGQGKDLVLKMVEKGNHKSDKFIEMKGDDVSNMNLPQSVADNLKAGLKAAQKVRTRNTHMYARDPARCLSSNC
jgi:hypothetical protein